MPIPEIKKRSDNLEEDWLITYSDAITLLLAFFVMIITFAEFDVPAFQEVANAIKNQVGKHDDISPSDKLKLELEDVVFEAGADRAVQISKDRRGVVIDLASSAFYKPGSAELRPEAIPVLNKIVDTLTLPRYQTFKFAVEGHTDDDPISTDKFPTNWELAAHRATRVVRYFAEKDTDVLKLHATSFGDTRPKVANRDAGGAPIKENQATNRRTAIRVEPMSIKEQEAFFTRLALKRAKEAEEKAKAEREAREKAAAEAAERGEGPAIGAEPGIINAPAPAN